MFVYVVMCVVEYEGSSLVSVYTNEDEAKDACVLLNDEAMECGCYDSTHMVITKEVL